MVFSQLFRRQDAQARILLEQTRILQEQATRQDRQDALIETLVMGNQDLIKFTQEMRREDMERMEEMRREDAARMEKMRREDAERRREDAERMERILLAALERRASNGDLGGNSGGDADDS